MTANAYTSVFSDTAPLRICSGERYSGGGSGVVMPVLGSSARRSANSTSMSLTLPSSPILTFRGRSAPCTIPMLWSVSTAPPSSMAQRRAVVTSSSPSARISLRRHPWATSMATKAWLFSASPNSNTPTSAGWAVDASTRDRPLRSSVCAALATPPGPPDRNRIATSWVVASSSARHTVPKAPAPNSLTIRYRPCTRRPIRARSTGTKGGVTGLVEVSSASLERGMPSPAGTRVPSGPINTKTLRAHSPEGPCVATVSVELDQGPAVRVIGPNTLPVKGEVDAGRTPPSLPLLRARRRRGILASQRLEDEARHPRMPLGGVVLDVFLHDGHQLAGRAGRPSDAVLEAHQHLLARRALLGGHEGADGRPEVHQIVDDAGDVRRPGRCGQSAPIVAGHGSRGRGPQGREQPAEEDEGNAL